MMASNSQMSLPINDIVVTSRAENQSDGSSAVSPVMGTGKNWSGDDPVGQKPAGERRAPGGAATLELHSSRDPCSLEARHDQGVKIQEEVEKERAPVEGHARNLYFSQQVGLPHDDTQSKDHHSDFESPFGIRYWLLPFPSDLSYQQPPSDIERTEPFPAPVQESGVHAGRQELVTGMNKFEPLSSMKNGK